MKSSNVTNKRTRSLLLMITSIVSVGFIASSVFAQQYYSQPVYSSSYNQNQIQSQTVYPQSSSYQVYESVPTPYPSTYDGNQVVSSYSQSTVPQNVTYPAYSSTPVVYDSAPVYQSSPVVYQSAQNSQPIVESYPTAYQSPQPVTYPASSPIVSYPSAIVSSTPVVSYPTGTYSSNGIYASSSYSQPATYTAASPPAQPVTYSQPNYSQPVATNYTASTGSSYASTGNVTPGLAQQKAAQAAQMGLQGHLNNQLGGAKYEGVGWSNQSAQSAIQNCCYWGTRPTAQIGVSQASDGTWYACVLYH